MVKMKKAIVFFVVLLAGGYHLPAERIELMPSTAYKYENGDGTLDWDTFYAEWENAPDSYYIHIKADKKLDGNPLVTSILARVNGEGWGGEGGYIEFHYAKKIGNTEDPNRIWIITIDIRFTPSKSEFLHGFGYEALGIKSSNYNKAIQKWNSLLGQYK